MFQGLKGRYITIKGQVQSGKTKYMICMSTLCLLNGYSVVILLRNNRADQEQIHERFMLFEKEINEYQGHRSTIFNICKTNAVNDTPRVYLTLGNASSVSKLTGLDKFVLFIDEVDSVDSGEGKKIEMIPILKENAHCVFGVSATIMDPLAKEFIFPTDIIMLTTPPNYKGIPAIQVEAIQDATYTSQTDEDLFMNDEGLLEFVEMFALEQPYLFADGFIHPHICLVNICRTKEPTMEALKFLAPVYQNIVIVVYNGDGIVYTYKNKMKEHQGTISSFLQHIKELGHPNILIFSGELAGRGISFTSSDFKWHLTSMRLLVSKQCDEPELIQRAGRLCGIYKDNIPLKLYSTYEILVDLKKAYFRQEEIIAALKIKESTSTCKHLIETMAISHSKFTKRRPTKDKKTKIQFNKVNRQTGWKMSVYNVEDVEEVEEREAWEVQEAEMDDVYMIIKDEIENPKYLAIYESVTEFLKTKSGWVSRGKIRDACRDTVIDARDLGTFQERYSNTYSGMDFEYILWRKNGREYEYKL